jgi:hypothetical protein
VSLGEAIEASITLDGGDGYGDLDGLAGDVGRAAEGGAVVVEEGAAGAAAVLGVAAGLDDGCDFFIGEELRDLVDEAQALCAGGEAGLHFGRDAAGGCAYREFGNVFEFFFGIAVEEGFVDGWDFAHGAEEDDFAGEFALVGVDVLFCLDVDVGHVAGDRAWCRRRPRRGLHDEDCGIGCDHAGPGVELLPAEAEFAPVFEMRVFEADLGEGVAGPLVGFFEIGGAGKTRADAIHERVSEVHDVGVVEAFVADALVGGEIEGFGGGLDFGVGVDFGGGFGLLRLGFICSVQGEGRSEREAGRGDEAEQLRGRHPMHGEGHSGNLQRYICVQICVLGNEDDCSVSELPFGEGVSAKLRCS